MDYARTPIYEYYGRKSEGTFGIEVEVEGANLPANVGPQWKSVAEGSLRGEAIEYIFRHPLSYPDTKKALEQLETSLRLSGAECVMSNRTSVHVHYNVSYMTFAQLYTAIAAYLLFENLLVRYAGDTREGNLFCLRISDAEMMMIELKSGIRSQSMFNGFNDNNRYAALNLASVQKQASIEFRSFRGSIQAAEILDWCDILNELIVRSAINYKHPGELAEDYVKIGAEGMVQKLLMDSFVPWVMKQADWTEQVDMNFGYVIQLATATDWDKDLEEKPKKKPVRLKGIEDEVLPIDLEALLERAQRPAQPHAFIAVWDEEERHINVPNPQLNEDL